MTSIPINPNYNGDRYYRYFMEEINIKIEGSGNGIKTVLVNIAKICKQLNRSENYLTKYLSLELASKYKFEDNKHILMGNFSKDSVQSKIYLFIKNLVICNSCGNPETKLSVKSQDVSIDCSACGKNSLIDKSGKYLNKLLVKIVRSENPKSIETIKQRKSRKTDAEKDIDTWGKFIYNDDKPIEDIKNPVLYLQEKITPTMDEKEIYTLSLEIKSEYSLNDIQWLQMVFEALFINGDLSKESIEINGSLLKRIVNDDPKLMKVLVEETIAVCNLYKEKGYFSKFPLFLIYFSNNDVISQEFILDWLKGKHSRSLCIDVQKEARKSARLLEDFFEGQE